MHLFMLLGLPNMGLFSAVGSTGDVFSIRFGAYRTYICYMFSGLQNICFICFGTYRAFIHFMFLGCGNDLKYRKIGSEAVGPTYCCVLKFVLQTQLVFSSIIASPEQSASERM